MYIKRYILSHINWSLNTFGLGMRTEGICKHIQSELEEIKAKPYDVEEWIDIIILGIDGAHRSMPENMTPEAKTNLLVWYLEHKQKKNIQREWPKVSEDEPSFHKKRNVQLQDIGKTTHEVIKKSMEEGTPLSEYLKDLEGS